MTNNRGSPVILYVDDEPPLLLTHKIILELRGYRVITCEDAIRSLTIVKENPVDLAILDYSFQRTCPLNGVQCAEKMLEVRKNLPILFLTAMPECIPPNLPFRNGVVIKGEGPEYLLDKVELILTVVELIDCTGEDFCKDDAKLVEEATLFLKTAQVFHEDLQEHLKAVNAHLEHVRSRPKSQSRSRSQSQSPS